MSQHIEDMEFNGCTVPTTKEWNPYNPFAMSFPTEELTVLEDKNLVDIYQNVVLGYPGISVEEYCNSDVHLLKDKMDTAIINTDEFKFMQWVYQLVQYQGEEDRQQVFQMSEDFYRSFIKDSNFSTFDKQAIFTNCWVKANLEISTIHQFTEYEHVRATPKLLVSRKSIPFYNLKFITLIVLRKLREFHMKVTYSNVCDMYATIHKELWKSIMYGIDSRMESQYDLTFQLDKIFYPSIHSWMDQGQQYELTVFSTDINILNS